MCGRFSQTASPEILAEQFAVTDPPLFPLRYNIAPSQPVVAIRIEPDTTTRRLVQLRWGLIPSWATDPKIGNQCINAKAETVAEKPAFRGINKGVGVRRREAGGKSRMKESYKVRPSQSPWPRVMRVVGQPAGRSVHRGTTGRCMELRKHLSAVADLVLTRGRQ